MRYINFPHKSRQGDETNRYLEQTLEAIGMSPQGQKHQQCMSD